jgi:hypothetical protein
MGAKGSKTTSTNESTVLNKNITNLMTTQIVNSATYVSNDQGIAVTGSGNILQDINMSQTITVNLQAYNDQSVMADLQNKVSAAIQQAAEAKGTQNLSSLLPGSSGDTTNVNNKVFVENYVQNNITSQQVTNLLTNIKNSQTLVVTGSKNILKGITMAQVSGAIQSQVASMVNKMALVNALDTSTSQTGKATTTNMFADIIKSIGDAIGSIFSGVLGGIMLPMIIVIVVIAALYFTFKPSAMATPTVPKSGSAMRSYDIPSY